MLKYGPNDYMKHFDYVANESYGFATEWVGLNNDCPALIS